MWKSEEDHRGTIIYSTTDGHRKTVTAIGEIPDGFVTKAPSTEWDVWDGKSWVTDTDAQHTAAVDAAEQQRRALTDAAMASISLIQLKLQASRTLTDEEQSQLNRTLDYIDAVNEMKTDILPVDWPTLD